MKGYLKFLQFVNHHKNSLVKKIIAGLFLFSTALPFTFAQTIAPSQDQKLYTKQDIKFELVIPNSKPENIQIQSPTLPAGVTLKTMRKTQTYAEVSGTLIELWYSFEKPGNYDLPRLTVLIQNRRRYFYYERFTISENPANMLPRIVIEFDNGKIITSDDPVPGKAVFTHPIGKKISFKVNLQYATQLVQFNWDIPKDSIFTQTATYDITEIKYREKKYTSDLIPVADFEWTALTKGLNPMPKIRLVATAYNGYRNELLLPNFAVEFVQSDSNDSQNENEDLMFNSAFMVTQDLLDDSKQVQITLEDCQEIVRLRHGEKSNFFRSYEFKKDRIELEESLDLPSEYEEFYSGFFILSMIFLVTSIILLIIFIRKHKKALQVLTTVLLTSALTLVIICSVFLSKKYGISTGAMIYSIPEENQNSIGEITAGNRVELIEKAGDWYYIEMGSINGWTKVENILE